MDSDKMPTGFYFVTIGVGPARPAFARQAQGIKKTEPIRCVIDTRTIRTRCSLDDNVTRENMHPADQFEASKKWRRTRLGRGRNRVRFGVTPHVVRNVCGSFAGRLACCSAIATAIWPRAVGCVRLDRRHVGRRRSIVG